MSETIPQALEALIGLFGKRSTATSELLPPDQQREEIGAAMLALSHASQPVDTGVERRWEPHERNYSGGRFGVWHTDDWTMLRVEAGGGDVTASIRANEAWDLGLRLSPALAKRIDYLFSEMKKAQAALHAFTWADTLAPTLRKVADEWDCGSGCERAGSSVCHEREDGCRFVEAEEMRQFADALELAAQLREQPITPPLDRETVERAREALRPLTSDELPDDMREAWLTDLATAALNAVTEKGHV